MKRSRRKKRRAVPIPVASMGDIAFLLIIFFLVCSEIAKQRDLPVTLPLSAHVKKVEAAVVTRVAVDRTGQIYCDGAPVRTAKDVESWVRSLLENTVADDQRHVQFTCDAELPKETFEPVLQAIAEAGGIIEAVGELRQ